MVFRTFVSNIMRILAPIDELGKIMRNYRTKFINEIKYFNYFVLTHMVMVWKWLKRKLKMSSTTALGMFITSTINSLNKPIKFSWTRKERFTISNVEFH